MLCKNNTWTIRMIKNKIDEKNFQKQDEQPSRCGSLNECQAIVGCVKLRKILRD